MSYLIREITQFSYFYLILKIEVFPISVWQFNESMQQAAAFDLMWQLSEKQNIIFGL